MLNKIQYSILVKVEYVVCDYGEMLCRYVSMCMKSLFHILFSQKQFCQQLFLVRTIIPKVFVLTYRLSIVNFIDNSQH